MIEDERRNASPGAVRRRRHPYSPSSILHPSTSLVRPVAGFKPFAELARGAAVVYKAYDPANERTVLLKVLTPEAATDPALVAWFEGEARAVADVQHPNVVALYSAGRAEGRPYLVAEFIEGRALADVLAEGPLPEDLAAYVAASAARGLAAAHERGLLHRDVKPGNVLLSTDGEVKLTDFGLATRVGVSDGVGGADVRGTPGYLAPEVVRGVAPGAAADLFGLGAILVESLTGKPAFPSDDAAGALDAALHHDPVPALRADLRVPEGLADIASHLLAKTPAARPATAAAAADALDAHRAGPGARARSGAADLAAFLEDPAAYVAARPAPAPAPRRATAPSRSAHPLRVSRTLVAVGLLVGLAAAALALRATRDRPQGAAPAPTETTGRITIGPPDDEVAALPVPSAPSGDAPVVGQIVDSEPPGLVEPDQTAPRDPPAATPAPTGTVLESPQSASAPASGHLTVAVEPWAEVFVDGRRLGTTPLNAPLTLAAGPHRIVLRNPEFPEFSTSVDVGAGAAERLAVSLWSLVGRISLEVSPWAEVSVDGRAVGTTPLRRALVLSPGAHTIRLSHPTLGVREESITVGAGESNTLRIRMGAGGS